MAKRGRPPKERTIRFEDLPDVMTPTQLRDFLKIDKDELYRMLYNGEIPCHRRGNRFYIHKYEFGIKAGFCSPTYNLERQLATIQAELTELKQMVKAANQ